MMISSAFELPQQSMVMRWEKVELQSTGPGKRWGHTCNAVQGGRFVYVFGGYDGVHQCQTNRVHVFDTVHMLWSEPLMKRTPPIPRDSHSCTTVGNNLFVFGGTDGRKPLNDLHVLDTSSNTWFRPSSSGNGPEAREGHSAALIGKRLFIFGGCGKSENSEVYYDDLYILDTETYSWRRVVTTGTPPSKRNSHTCSSWLNKIIVVGGEDSSNYYLSDVHILDADSFVWCKLNTTGQLFPPRGGHTTVSFDKKFFIFGGYSDEQNLYDDVHVLDLEKGTWTKVLTAGEGPSGRFSMAGQSLDPQMPGVVFFIGGCNKNLEALNDIYFLHTGLYRERRTEKLSLRKQLKLKCQEQLTISPLSMADHDTTIYQAMPISSYTPPPPGGQDFYMREPLKQMPLGQSVFQAKVVASSGKALGKRTFQAKVVTSSINGYSIETVLDGKALRGMLFPVDPIRTTITETPHRQVDGAYIAQNSGGNVNGSANSAVDTEMSVRNLSYNVKPADIASKEKVAENQETATRMEDASVDIKNSDAVSQIEIVASDAMNTSSSVGPEVFVTLEPAMGPLNNAPSNVINPSLCDAEMFEVDASASFENQKDLLN